MSTYKKRVICEMVPWCKALMYNRTRHIIVHGGRGSGKSEGLAQLLLIKSLCEEGIRIVCGREIQRTIRESSKALIEKWIDLLDIRSLFTITQYNIVNKKTKAQFLFFGLSDVTKNNMTSISNIKYLWIDEAHTITQETWKRVYPSIRAQNSQIYVTFNPHFETDVIYKEFVTQTREDAYVVQVNYNKNKWFSQTPLEQQRLIDKALKPRLYYEHVWEGALCEYNDDAIIDINKFDKFDLTSINNYSKLVITIDTAYSTKEYADYSALGAFGLCEDKVHVLCIKRGRWEFHDLKCELIEFYNDIKNKYKKVDKVIIENKAAGLSLIQELRRTTSIYIEEYTPTKDKYTRVVEALETLHSGRFCVPHDHDIDTSWLRAYTRELSLFTANGTHQHDDQVDITTMAIKALVHKQVYIDYKELNKLLSRA